jgi:large subunit ribosomal protein L21
MEQTGLQIPEKYAIFQTGGKQYQAVVGKTLGIEKLDLSAGDAVTFNDVLLVKLGDAYKVGAPFVANATITAEIVKQTQGPKLIIFKFKRRKKYRVKNGHRQPITVVRFMSIDA